MTQRIEKGFKTVEVTYSQAAIELMDLLDKQYHKAMMLDYHSDLSDDGIACTD